MSRVMYILREVHKALVTTFNPDTHGISAPDRQFRDPDHLVVVEWLNAARGSESYERVVHLVGELREVSVGLNRVFRQAGFHSLGPVSLRNRQQDLSQRHIQINEQLNRYSYSPVVQRVLIGQSWRLSMRSQGEPSGFVLKRVDDEGQRTLSDGSKQISFHYRHDVSEADVVFRILRLAESDELDRLRQCEQCLRWFYAERSHQRFCPGAKCRLTNYSSSPKQKKYRKLYMRKKRAEERARKADAKSSTRKPR